MNMKTRTLILLLLAALTPLRAQIQQGLEEKNRFSIGPRLSFNISASLRNVPVPANTGPDYDDGFVRDDSSANAGGLTWNWGYSRTNQIFGASPARELELHGVSSPRDGTTDNLEQAMQYGFEMTYGREFWRFGKSDAPIRVGFEGSFGASALALDDENLVTGIRTRTADRYPLGSVIPPPAPYSGSFFGPAPPNPPGPLIGTNLISRTTSPETVQAFQRAEIDGTFWGFRLGPFVEVPLVGRFQGQFGAGLAFMYADVKLSYFESFSTTGIGGPPPDRQDAQSTDQWLFGFYAEGKVQYWLNEVVALYLGGQFQTLEDMSLGAFNKEATIDFGTTFAVTLGVTYAF